MSEINIYTQKYKKINSSLNQKAKEKIKRTHNKGICFWCEINKAEFPKENPILCLECFVSPLKDELERRASAIQSHLMMIKAMPNNYAKKYQDIIIQMIKEGKKLGDFFEDC